MTTTVAYQSRVRESSAPGGRRRRLPAPIRFLLFLLVLALAAGLLLIGQVVSSARAYDTARADALVVLGAAQYWGEPSPVLANRLDHAAELYRQGIAPEIVTVGGGIPGDKTTEAQAGADYLVARGVPAEDIEVIPSGSDTIESLEAVAERADRENWHSLAIVSDRAHVARSAAIARGLGFETSVSGPAGGDGSLLSFERVLEEAVGLGRFYLWDRWLLSTG